MKPFILTTNKGRYFFIFADNVISAKVLFKARYSYWWERAVGIYDVLNPKEMPRITGEIDTDTALRMNPHVWTCGIKMVKADVYRVMTYDSVCGNDYQLFVYHKGAWYTKDHADYRDDDPFPFEKMKGDCMKLRREYACNFDEDYDIMVETQGDKIFLDGMELEPYPCDMGKIVDIEEAEND